jgi:hypothetical protein
VTPAEVLARHVPVIDGDYGQECNVERQPWPCDAVDQARQLQEAQERVARLEVILGLHNQTPTGKVRPCLPGCIACAALAQPDSTGEREVE